MLLHCLLNGIFKDIHEHFEMYLFWSSHPNLIYLNLLGIRYSEHADIGLYFTLWNSFAYSINSLWSSKIMAKGSCASTDLYFLLLTVLLRFVYSTCKKKNKENLGRDCNEWCFTSYLEAWECTFRKSNQLFILVSLNFLFL